MPAIATGLGERGESGAPVGSCRDDDAGPHAHRTSNEVAVQARGVTARIPGRARQRLPAE